MSNETPEAEVQAKQGSSGEDTTFSYISFYLAGQLLGIPIERVQEVITEQDICQVPLSPTSVAGLLNLRGQIVTAVDLRQRLALPDGEGESERMNIIVKGDGELFSLIVDAVGDVIEVPRDSLETPPATLDDCWRKCCEGVHRLEKGLLIVVDVTQLLDVDVSETREATPEAASQTPNENISA